MEFLLTFFMTSVGQAGNVANVEIEKPCSFPGAWSSGNEKEKESFRRSINFRDASFKDGNRRQELAFNGQELKHAFI